MKINKWLFLPVFAAFLSFFSCQMTEEVFLNKDGSGSYHFKVDMSAMADFVEQQDSVKGKNKLEKLDTIFYVSDYLKKNREVLDTLPEKDKMLLESLKNFKIHTLMDEEKGVYFYEMSMDFDNASELYNMTERINKLSQLNSKVESESSNDDTKIYHKVKYEFKGRIFARRVNINPLFQNDRAKYDKKLKDDLQFLSGSPYHIVIHFPRRVKKASIDGYKLSDDGKTLIIDTTIDSLMRNPKLYDFEVKLRYK